MLADWCNPNQKQVLKMKRKLNLTKLSSLTEHLTSVPYLPSLYQSCDLAQSAVAGECAYL